MRSNKEAKVSFLLEQDEDDWPPVATEAIWADFVAEHLYRLRNVPFFAVGVSLGDVVRTEKPEAVERFVSVVEPSTNSTLHVFCFSDNKRAVLTDWLKQQGWEWEYGFKKQYLAINVPASSKVNELISLLVSLEVPEEFEYEFSSKRFSTSADSA